MRLIFTAPALLAVGILLAGCPNNGQPPTVQPQDQAAYLEQALTAGETAWVGFLTLCNNGGAAKIKACNDTSVLDKGSEQRQKAYAAVKAYKDAVASLQAQSTLDELLAAANGAVSGFSGYANTLPKGP